MLFSTFGTGNPVPWAKNLWCNRGQARELQTVVFTEGSHDVLYVLAPKACSVTLIFKQFSVSRDIWFNSCTEVLKMMLKVPPSI